MWIMLLVVAFAVIGITCRDGHEQRARRIAAGVIILIVGYESLAGHLL
jgi:hypothetical protein